MGYKDESRVFKCRVEKTNAIVNALNRTKREEHPDLAALQEERAKEHRRYGCRGLSAGSDTPNTHIDSIQRGKCRDTGSGGWKRQRPIV